MPIGIVGGNATAVDAAAPSLSTPGGIAPDDLMLAVSSRADNNDPSISTAGYTLTDDGSSWGFTGQSAKVSRKKMSGTPDSAIASNFNASFGNGLAFICFSGVDPTTPIDATLVETNSHAPGASADAITTVTNGAEVVVLGAQQNSNTGNTGCSGYGNSQSAGVTGGSGRDTNVSIQSKNKATAGLESPGTFVAAWKSGNLVLNFTVALRPAAGAAAASFLPPSMLSRFHHMLVR